MTDLTPLFRQCVNIVQSELGDSIQPQPQPIKHQDEQNYFVNDTFIKESQEFYTMLIQMNKYIRDIKAPYLAISDEYANTSTLSIDDKNEIDQDFNFKVQQMYKKLNHLEVYESKRQKLTNDQDNTRGGWFNRVFTDDEASFYHETVAAHRKQVLLFLMETLNYVNKTFDSIQQKRLSRERQLNLLNFQDIQDDQMDVDHIANDLDIIDTNGQFEDEQVPSDQLQELEFENREFLNLKTTQLKQVEKVQQSILDIVNIQNELSFKLQDQGNQIGNLMDTHSEIEMEVTLGNKTLNKSKKSNKKAANMLVTMAVIFGVFILFVDYISF
ncbi:uncharacterized protein SPAPADRAFT_144549 [Spathaspora passalidarum NRRL Y-27907]|uniref:t-SNARE coiled-coil homology domain-containing protein n=1 Tax=Spathaspora passalidarum (strain NRRL Y-27907 / 11-Y1) TaxID=619300 RepID=G3AVH4_SPAPN|nr:uncharacterized protein SPAPADRAFT_144549 [Spathaspora passalidarum NRRL Y-27907]EGW29923.1 hypothetical protein SPAPADRAFT_144549 [Spathaspora passalidarum NRRL Y-27907]